MKNGIIEDGKQLIKEKEAELEKQKEINANSKEGELREKIKGLEMEWAEVNDDKQKLEKENEKL